MWQWLCIDCLSHVLYNLELINHFFLLKKDVIGITAGIKRIWPLKDYSQHFLGTSHLLVGRGAEKLVGK